MISRVTKTVKQWGENDKNEEKENQKNENFQNRHLPKQMDSKIKHQNDKEDEILQKEIQIKKMVFKEVGKYPKNATFEQTSALDREYLQKCQNALNELRNENKKNHQKEIEAIENKTCCCFNCLIKRPEDKIKEKGLESANADSVGKVISQFTNPDFQWYGVYPFNEQNGGDAVAEVFWIPFLSAWSNVQRRQDVFLAGTSEIDNTDWVISMGNFMGLLDGNWLGFPASRKIAFLRYADFNCIKDGKIIRSSFFCDLIGLMHQLGLNPLPLQTGASFVYPGPRTHDGLLIEPQDQQESQKTLTLVNQMIGDLTDLNKNENFSNSSFKKEFTSIKKQKFFKFR